MRKGRSQRKTRGSLPPLSTRPHATGAGAEASAPRSRGPQVVIGLTGPRSEEGEMREARAPEPSAASRLGVASLAAPTLEILAEPSLELVHEQTLEIVREAPESDTYEAQDAYEPLETESADSLAGVEREAASDPFARVLAEETPIPVPHTTSLPTPDELSIPPMGDLSVEPIAERFFSEGELSAAHGVEEETWDQAQDKIQRKSHPHVVERRQRFSRYVRWAVGGAAVVCLAALARTTMVPQRAPSASVAVATVAPKAAAQAVLAPEPVKAPEAVKAPEPVAAVAAPESVSAPKVDVPKAEEPKAVDAPVLPAAPAAPAPAAAVATGDKTALQEKTDARRNLERGKLAEAIAAGERSVALDPADGEAWLLLGAAYQEKGNNAEARRCYKSCLSEGKRGPTGECRAMIR